MRCWRAIAGSRKRSRVTRALHKLAGALLLGLVLAGSAGAESHEYRGGAYDPKEAGHPLRIAAYVLHPIGVILDRLILRPAYWLGSHEPIKTLVGRTD